MKRIIITLLLLGSWINSAYSEEIDIFSAIQNHDIAYIKEYVAYKNLCGLISRPNDCNAQDSEGLSLLHHAVKAGYKDSIELLIQAGGDVNLQDKVGKTPLHVVIDLPCLSQEKCDVETIKAIIQLLADAGADSTVQDSEGKSPVDYANSLFEFVFDRKRAILFQQNEYRRAQQQEYYEKNNKSMPEELLLVQDYYVALQNELKAYDVKEKLLKEVHQVMPLAAIAREQLRFEEALRRGENKRRAVSQSWVVRFLIWARLT